jgi:hypothetical protein
MKLSVGGAEQWELLQVAHQLFCSPLLCYNSLQASSQGTLQDDRFKNHKDFFRIDVKMILLHVQPDWELSAPAFEKCLDALDNLLAAFESLLDDGILNTHGDEVHDLSVEILVCLKCASSSL